MRFAVIGDIHSNQEALKSVLSDIKEQEVDFIVSTGDLVGYLPYPNEVIKMIREAKVLVVKGNHDKVIAEAAPLAVETLATLTTEEVCAKASAKYTNAVLTEANRKYLDNLPTHLVMQQDGLKIVVVHGSPSRIDEYLFEDAPALETISAEGVYDVVICGHTHLPYHRAIDGKHFINAGSVGKPKHGNAKSAYAIVTIEQGCVTSTFREVSYDVEKMAQAITENPYIADDLIGLLRTGC